MEASTINSETARDQFLHLLVTQLQHQDPFEPVKQSDFLGQLAQFSTLEGIEKLNANFADMLKLQELTNGSSLLGKTVVYSVGEGTETQEGVVESVQYTDGTLTLGVGNASIALDQVQALVNNG